MDFSGGEKAFDQLLGHLLNSKTTKKNHVGSIIKRQEKLIEEGGGAIV